MPVRGHRRLILLFLLAVLVPALVLVVVGARTIRQEKELARTRLAEERRRHLAELREVFASELDRLGREREGRAVLLAAPIDASGRLLLPWEERRKSPIEEPGFAAAVLAGEKAELSGDARSADSIYRGAMSAARDPAQEAYARLLLARSLSRSGRNDEANEAYRELFLLSSELVDEHGVPFFAYGAHGLLEAGLAREEVKERLGTELSTRRFWSPAAAYFLRTLAQPFPLDRYLSFVEQALALERDLPSLPTNVWVPYGEELWLVKKTETLLAVRSDRLLEGRPAWHDVVFLTGEGGEPLGVEFPGLKVALPPADESLLERQWVFRDRLWMSALALVVALTLFGGTLLWRDVRRELRLAELRSHFVSSVSHELKTPLTSIRMFAETLRLGRLRDRKVQDEYLATIVHESERLTRLLGDVLDFSLLERGEKTYRFRSVPLTELVRSAVRTIEHPLATQGFDLRVDIGDDDTTVQADADAIEQALLNLLTNAVKYSGDSRTIGLNVATENGHAVIRVSDSGLGIPEKERKRIFEKFYRVPGAENERIPGAGLGLTLVERVARAHGGEVQVESVPGKGSTFSLYIPLESGS